MKRIKKNGVTLIELLIALAIIAVVITAVVPFFNGNFRTLSSTQVKEELQDEGRKAISYLTNKSMQSSGVNSIVDISGVDRTAEKTIISISKIELRSHENQKDIFDVRDSKLYYGTGNITDAVTVDTLIANYVQVIEIKPLPELPAPNDVAFEKCNGISITIKLKKSNVEDSIKTNIYFRNNE